jgi:hypothetical protein
MTKTSTVKSQARSDNAKKLLAGLPRDPVTGRLMKRTGAGGDPPDPARPAPPPAGGPASAPPFVPGRGLRRWRRHGSG